MWRRGWSLLTPSGQQCHGMSRCVEAVWQERRRQSGHKPWSRVFFALYSGHSYNGRPLPSRRRLRGRIHIGGLVPAISLHTYLASLGASEVGAASLSFKLLGLQCALGNLLLLLLLLCAFYYLFPCLFLVFRVGVAVVQVTPFNRGGRHHSMIVAHEHSNSSCSHLDFSTR